MSLPQSLPGSALPVSSLNADTLICKASGTAAEDKLEILGLALTPCGIRFTNAAEIACLILRPVIEVIEEDAPQAAPLIPVLAVEVVVCPLLEPGVVGWVVRIADTLCRA